MRGFPQPYVIHMRDSVHHNKCLLPERTPNDPHIPQFYLLEGTIIPQNRSFFARACGHAPLKRDRDREDTGTGLRDRATGPGTDRDRATGTGPGPGRTGPRDRATETGPPEFATSGGGLRARDFLVSQKAV